MLSMRGNQAQNVGILTSIVKNNQLISRQCLAQNVDDLYQNKASQLQELSATKMPACICQATEPRQNQHAGRKINRLIKQRRLPQRQALPVFSRKHWFATNIGPVDADGGVVPNNAAFMRRRIVFAGFV